jgi:hypothetical protein
LAPTQSRQNLPGNFVASATTSAAGTANAVVSPSSSKAEDDAITKFTNYMKETPAERMQDTWLQAHGITRQQFDAMSPEEKQKIVDEMKQDIENKIKQKMESGSKPSVDIVA